MGRECLTRRDLLKGFLIVIGAAATSSCQGRSTYRRDLPPEIPSNKAIEKPPDINDLIKNYYPELEPSLSSLPHTTSNLNTGIPTAVHNFTDLSFDPKAAEQIYQAIDLLNMDPLGYDYDNDGEELNLNIQHQFPKSRSIFLVPKTASEPKNLRKRFGLLDDKQPDSFTVFDTKIPRAITIIRVDEKINFTGPFKGAKNIASLYFAEETSQQIYRIVVQNRSGRIITDENQIAYAQELFCKSVGYQAALRTLGVPYKNYLRFAETMSLIPNSEKSFLTFPIAGAVIE